MELRINRVRINRSRPVDDDDIIKIVLAHHLLYEQSDHEEYESTLDDTKVMSNYNNFWCNLDQQKTFL